MSKQCFLNHCCSTYAAAFVDVNNLFVTNPFGGKSKAITRLCDQNAETLAHVGMMFICLFVRLLISNRGFSPGFTGCPTVTEPTLVHHFFPRNA